MAPVAPSGALTRLGDLVEISKGISYQGRYLTAQGLPLVNLKCIGRGGGFRKDGLKPYSGPHKPHQMVVPGDIVVANTDLTQAGEIIGCPAVVPTLPNSDYGLISHHLCRVRPLDPAALDHRYLYYMLRAPRFRDHARSVASGTTVLGFRTADIEAFELLLPPISTQAVVGAALGAIDDLIENNRRRVDVLEEMARAIYREWFVNFRYPGHEDATFVDSPLGPIPEGWEFVSLVDEARITMGQSPKSEFYNSDGDGTPFHQGVTDFGTHFPTHRKYCTADGREAAAGDILVSVRAPVGRLNVADTRLVIGRGLAGVHSLRGHQGLLFGSLKEIFAEEDSMGGGTIFKAIGKKELEHVQVPRPPIDLAELANRQLSSQYELIRALTFASRRLASIRDVLLPRLVTGQIDVSSLDLDALVGAGAA